MVEMVIGWPPPSLRDANLDPAMQGTPFEVLARCWSGWLEPHRYRPLSNKTVREACGVEDVTASRTLDYIVEMGYVEEGPRGERGVRTFRVLNTRAARVA